MIIFWTLLVEVVPVNYEHLPFEMIKGIKDFEKLQVYLYGDQVTSWKNEKGEELLVMSRTPIFELPTAIREGFQYYFHKWWLCDFSHGQQKTISCEVHAFC